MIASLAGIVDDVHGDQLTLVVGGVGYLASVPLRLASTLGIGETVKIFTVQVVREDDISLYGFAEPAERTLFSQLRSVTGIGPKLALAIINHFDVTSLVRAIRSADEATLTRVPGLGAKTAKVLILSLSGKLDFAAADAGGAVAREATALAPELLESATAALTGLGWNDRLAREEIARAEKALAKNGQLPSMQELVRLALSELGKSRSVLSEPGQGR